MLPPRSLSTHTQTHHTRRHISLALSCAQSLFRSLATHLSLFRCLSLAIFREHALSLSHARYLSRSLNLSFSLSRSLARSLARSLSVSLSPTHLLIRCMQFASRSLSLARVRALSLLRHPPSNDQEAKRNHLVAALKCVPYAYSRTRERRVNRLTAHDCMHSLTRVLCMCARVLNANNTAKRASDCI